MPGRARAGVEAEILAAVRAHAPVRRALARVISRFVCCRGWERLGFARVRDYAVERLGLSARSVYDLAHVDGALDGLPHTNAAFIRGELPWTKVRLLARVASSSDEEQWVALAGKLTATALAREVRAVDVGALERSGLTGDEDLPGAPAYENIIIRCARHVQGKWYRARQLAARMAGRPVRPWECGEMVAAEVLSAVPLDDEVPAPGSTDNGTATVREVLHVPGENGRQHHQQTTPARPAAASTAVPGSSLPEPAALPPFLRRVVAGLTDLDAFQLDARLRHLVRLEQRLDAEVGRLLAVVAREQPYRARGITSLERYASDCLGLSPRKVRALLRLERAAATSPALARAYREGRISWVQAHALVPVLILLPGDQRRVRAWVDWAAGVSVRRLEDDVDRALLLQELDREAFEATGGLPADVQRACAPGADAAGDAADDGAGSSGSATAERRRQIGAHPSVFPETSHLFFHTPRDVAQLFQAVLCSVRRRIERKTGRLPTEGEAFEAMLDHACETWGGYDVKVRAAHRVFARDGWRCTVPGCSSLRNLQDHHIVFRSRGGSNAIENRTTLCAWHHLRGVHARRVRCAGTAPHTLRFDLGLRWEMRPLLSFAAGERLLRITPRAPDASGAPG